MQPVGSADAEASRCTGEGCCSSAAGTDSAGRVEESQRRTLAVDLDGTEVDRFGNAVEAGNQDLPEADMAAEVHLEIGEEDRSGIGVEAESQARLEADTAVEDRPGTEGARCEIAVEAESRRSLAAAAAVGSEVVAAAVAEIVVVAAAEAGREVHEDQQGSADRRVESTVRTVGCSWEG